MSWHQILPTSDPHVVKVIGSHDPSWLPPNTPLFTADHKKLTVVDAQADSTDDPQLRVTLKHKLFAKKKKPPPPGFSIWFTLDKEVAREYIKEHKNNRQQQQNQYPELPGGGGGGGGGGGFGNVAALTSNNLYGDEQPNNSLEQMEEEDHVFSLSKNESNRDKTICLPFLFFMALHVGIIAVNNELCKYIGSFRVWTSVVGYVFLGYQLIAMASSVIATLVCRRFFHAKCEMVNFPLVIANFVLVLAIGIPTAWSAGRTTAANNWLEGRMTQVVHCWRQPNMTFSQLDTSFIVLSEPTWDIDYVTRYKQKIVADVDPGENKNSVKTYYNYIVAPMRYTGNVPCHINIWVVCFSTTKTNVVESIKPHSPEARACGWDLPPTAVVLRVVNNNEAFYNFAPAEDTEWWYKAWILTGQGILDKRNPKHSVFAWYGGETPDDLLTEYYKAEDISLVIETCYYALGCPILAIIAMCMLLAQKGGGGECECCSDCDCDCCD